MGNKADKEQVGVPDGDCPASCDISGGAPATSTDVVTHLNTWTPGTTGSVCGVTHEVEKASADFNKPSSRYDNVTRSSLKPFSSLK